MNFPTRFSTVPVLVQQLGESALTGTAMHRDNARRTLIVIKEFIEWVLKETDNKPATKK